MTGHCPAFDPLDSFITGLTAYVDCQVGTLSENGYQALVAPGSPLSLALTGLLTIYVAFIGYRLLLGDVPRTQGLVTIIARAGLVIALATQWPAYQTIIYNVITQTPSGLVSRVLTASSLPGSDRSEDLVPRMQWVYANLRLEKTSFFDGPNDPANSPPMSKPGLGMGAPPPSAPVRVQPSQTFDNNRPDLPEVAFWYALSTTAAIISVRLVAGMALVLGPAFIMAALFEGMRGLTVGWLRTLAASAIGSIFVSLLQAVELSILEPQVNALISRHVTTHLTMEIQITVAMFGIGAIVVLLGSAFIASAWRLPDPAPVYRQLAQAMKLGAEQSPNLPAYHRLQRNAAFAPSPAAAVSQAVRAAEQRENAARVDVRVHRDAPAPRGAQVTAPSLRRLGEGGSRLDRRPSRSQTLRDKR